MNLVPTCELLFVEQVILSVVTLVSC